MAYHQFAARPTASALFWLLEGVAARDGVPMPPVKPEIDPVQKDIYPELYGPGGLMVGSKEGES